MDEERSDSDDTNTSYGRGYETILLYRIRRSTGWMAFFTLVIAIGMAGAGYLFWQQLNRMEELSDQVQGQVAASQKAVESLSELVEQSIDAINKQTGAAQKLAEIAASGQLASQKLTEIASNGQLASQKLAEIATNSQLVSNRPWVGIESVVPTRPLTVNQRYEFKVVIRNGGRSPALAVRTVLNTAVHATNDETLPNVDECGNCARSTMLPNGSRDYDVGSPDVLSKDVIERIKRGVNTILLVGRIDYTDSTAKARLTTVCMKYLPASGSFSSCTQGNDFN
jgi:hypothetical protein